MQKIAWYSLDWKNPDNYMSIITTETPNDVCAWEFLRRNLEYQYDYFEYARTGQFPNYVPHLNQDDSTDMCDWYGIDSQSKNFDPKVDIPPTFYIDATPTFTTRSFNGRNLPSEFMVRLSVELDRDIQLKAIKDHFDEFEKKCNAKFTINKKNYGIYLRILDALSAGISENEITDGYVAITCNVRKGTTAESYVKQAKALRDQDYIKILKGKIFYPKPEKGGVNNFV
ncbi:hypothetical protein R2083_08945 [Nitrosomonas sp. Is35]|uniref:transcriptional regulator domain-containing protein n=1 Tax=Nitrosomonas sp. Is35 TaxID=3080534 RepID=UPI00294ACAB5|nr:hypothetical protein [Nitrosomonas sp. Is35]MDV6347641.1 hypothetical protein [Nitrosomonas sp. Is35]